MKKIFVILLFFIVVFPSFSQKAVLLTDKEEIISQAKKELDAAIQSGELKEFVTLNNIKGEYIFDITIHEKGKVLTVFVVSSDADEMSKQNLLKTKVREFQFNFKMPKGKSYKFQYIFDL